MWEPLTGRDFKCIVIDSWRGHSNKTVFCLLDPPRYAIGEDAYRRAQRAMIELYSDLQGQRDIPLPVGLQDEFWFALERAKRPSFLGKESATSALERVGYGIAAALVAAAKPPDLLRLEVALPHPDYSQLEAQARSWMATAAPLFRDMRKAFDEIVPQVCSHQLVQFWELAKDYHRNGKLSLSSYLQQMIELSNCSGVTVEAETRTLARLLKMDEEMDATTLLLELRRLEEDIKAKSDANGIDPLAALELYIYEMRDRHEHDPDYHATIEYCQGLLEEGRPSAVPDTVIARMSRSVNNKMGSYLVRGEVRKGHEVNRPRSRADWFSRLLEVAIILGIDVEKYNMILTYVYTENLQREFLPLGGGLMGRVVSRATEGLERQVWQSLAAGHERVRALEQSMQLMGQLQRMHIGYDSHTQEELRAFRTEAVCKGLDELGFPIPQEWLAMARHLDINVCALRHYVSETLCRGKRLGRALLARMEEEGVRTSILVCDSYLQQVLGTVFRGRASYSFLVPAFRQ